MRRRARLDLLVAPRQPLVEKLEALRAVSVKLAEDHKEGLASKKLGHETRRRIELEMRRRDNEKRKAEDEAAALRKELASAELVAKKHSRWRMR